LTAVVTITSVAGDLIVALTYLGKNQR